MNRNVNVPFLGEERTVTFISLPDPRTKPKQAKRVKGYQTGDIVRAVMTQGKKIGTYVGKVAVRSSGSFNITTTHGVVQGISHRSCTPIHRSDGYRYEKGAAAFPPVA